MNKPASSLDRAAGFIWRNARLLERAMFAREFLGGAPAAVIDALMAYRNPDGGFGNALEPDVRAPGSMPLHCEQALWALRESDIRDPRLAMGVCDYLSSVAEPSARVEIVSGELSLYPRAAHWTGSFDPASPNPTAGLVGLLRFQAVEHPWLARATRWSERRLERPLEEAHEVLCAMRFFEHANDRKRAQESAVKIASAAGHARLFRADPFSSEYGITPLQLCPAPDSIARPAFPDVVLSAHLDALAARQQDDGGWPITWSPPSPAAECEWRGRLTYEALKCLHSWARI
ncbi:MAG: hypothetical protein JO121_08720 [Deltaproteobacteria bacterium]|nr:hypothetical protein [Deltaproteobacteria bacterium]